VESLPVAAISGEAMRKLFELDSLKTISIPSSVIHIGTSSLPQNDGITIIAPEDSCAARFAQENGIAYKKPGK